MKDSITIVGMDVHKNSIQIALAETGESDEIRSYGRIGGTMAALEGTLGTSFVPFSFTRPISLSGPFHEAIP